MRKLVATVERSSSPTAAEVRAYLARSNWGRWGDDDQRGTVNLITPAKILEASRCIREGRTLSLSRPFPTIADAGNPKPAEHFTKTFSRLDGGFAVDYYGIFYHGFNATHIDALCHVWDSHGLYNGRDPRAEIARSGSSWGDVAQWADGIVTRGVLLDVAGHRGVPSITVDEPIHGDELAQVARDQGVEVSSGDALLVHGGREEWSRANGPLGAAEIMPGLHASCLPFIRDHDIAVLAGDFTDTEPTEYADLAWTVHGAIHAYGLAVIDNALLSPLAEACAERSSYEFMFMIAPLRVLGGTGSPVNPIAVL
jgi:kynurenine formamidase